MKIVVGIDSLNYKNHKEQYQELEKICSNTNHSIESVDFADGESEFYNKVMNNEIDWMITFDMVGFAKRTVTEGTVYNLLHCKMVHLLFDNINTYPLIEERMNFSMFLFMNLTDQNQTAEEIMRDYPNIPNLEGFKGYPHLLDWMSQIRI